MNPKNRKPTIRFKAFNDPWEQRKLGQLAEIVGGGTPDTTVKEYWNGDINWYAPAEIGDKIFLESSQRKITPLGLQKSSARILPPGTVLFTSRAGIGNTAILQTEATTNQGFQSIVPHKNELNTYFIYSCTTYLKRYAETVAGGSTFLEISKKMMEKMTLFVPVIEEQKKVGVFYKKLDDLITLHQRKLDKLQNIKKACLEKMFPQNGESVPRIRFKGFTDTWEQREFGDLVKRASEQAISNTQLPGLEYEDLISETGQLNKDISKKKSNKKGLLFDKGDILFGKLRPYLKNWLLADFSGVAIGDFWVLRPENVDNSFIYSLIQTPTFSLISNISSGSKMPRSDWGYVSSATFKLPRSKTEQVQIGNLFQQVDSLITLHQRKLDKLKNLKKACLEKMFV